MRCRPFIALAIGLIAMPAASVPASEAVQVGVGGYYGYGYGYRYRFGHWGYPTWFYDPWPLGAYYGPARRWAAYPPPQPLWNGSSVVWLHPAPPAGP
jgi:hypothetical protein